MLGKLHLETGKPVGVGARRVGKQLAARAQRRFIAVAMLRVARIEREHQPVEEAPPVPRGLDEQPVHCGGQPQYRQPFAERRRRGGGSAEHTSELPSPMRISYTVFCLKKKMHIHKHSELLL